MIENIYDFNELFNLVYVKSLQQTSLKWSTKNFYEFINIYILKSVKIENSWWGFTCCNYSYFFNYLEKMDLEKMDLENMDLENMDLERMYLEMMDLEKMDLEIWLGLFLSFVGFQYSSSRIYQRLHLDSPSPLGLLLCHTNIFCHQSSMKTEYTCNPNRFFKK